MTQPPPDTVAELRRVALFAALPPSALEHLAGCLTVVESHTGERVFQEDDDAHDMFVVIDGEMEILKRSRGGTEARIALLGPGDWFGEMGLVDIQPRSASVRALAPTRLLRVSAADLDSLYRYDLKAYSLIVLNLAREMSRRLRVADGILADLIANVTDTYVTRRH